jgi:hypothetical protein
VYGQLPHLVAELVHLARLGERVAGEVLPARERAADEVGEPLDERDRAVDEEMRRD